MKTYTAYVPSSHDDFELGVIKYYPERNEAIWYEHGKAPQTFYSVNAAFERVKQQYSNVFMETA